MGRRTHRALTPTFDRDELGADAHAEVAADNVRVVAEREGSGEEAGRKGRSHDDTRLQACDSTTKAVSPCSLHGTLQLQVAQAGGAAWRTR